MEEELNIHRYFIYLKNRNYEIPTAQPLFIKYEIHEKEYNRILNLLEKLNLVEIEEHNEMAISNKLPEKIINGDINGILGLKIK